MREYLISFCKEFGYEHTDAQCLLSAYDCICAQPPAAELLCGAVRAYEANADIDYQTEILGRAKKISEITGVHAYTADLLVFILLTKHLKKLYQEKGLDLQIYRDSVLDLKWKLEECKAIKGVCGTFVAAWFPGFFNLSRFALGRLQFELKTADYDYSKNGIRLEKGKSTVINVHIPRTGTPIDKESCDKAYASARAFFKGQAGEFCPFVCHSWLLYPENKNIIPKHTNTYRFMSEYDIIDWGTNEGQDLWRLFDTEEKDPDKLPVNGSLRRGYAAHLKNGGAVGWGYGVRF